MAAEEGGEAAPLPSEGRSDAELDGEVEHAASAECLSQETSVPQTLQEGTNLDAGQAAQVVVSADAHEATRDQILEAVAESDDRGTNLDAGQAAQAVVSADAHEAARDQIPEAVAKVDDRGTNLDAGQVAQAVVSAHAPQAIRDPIPEADAKAADLLDAATADFLIQGASISQTFPGTNLDAGKVAQAVVSAHAQEAIRDQSPEADAKVDDRAGGRADVEDAARAECLSQGASVSQTMHGTNLNACQVAQAAATRDAILEVDAKAEGSPFEVDQRNILAQLSDEQLREMAGRLARSVEHLTESYSDVEAEREDLKIERDLLREHTQQLGDQLRRLNIDPSNTREPTLEGGSLNFVGRLWQQVRPRDNPSVLVRGHVDEVACGPQEESPTGEATGLRSASGYLSEFRESTEEWRTATVQRVGELRTGDLQSSASRRIECSVGAASEFWGTATRRIEGLLAPPVARSKEGRGERRKNRDPIRQGGFPKTWKAGPELL